MERPSPERSIIHIGCIEYRVYVAQALLLPLPGRPSHAKSSCGCAAPATNEIPVEPCISPSPGTPGEGRGEGLFLVHGRALTLTLFYEVPSPVNSRVEISRGSFQISAGPVLMQTSRTPPPSHLVAELFAELGAVKVDRPEGGDPMYSWGGTLTAPNSAYNPASR